MATNSENYSVYDNCDFRSVAGRFGDVPVQIASSWELSIERMNVFNGEAAGDTNERTMNWQPVKLRRLATPIGVASYWIRICC